MKNFWQHLKKPIWILAPMEDVTDTVFRQIIIKAGRPAVFFTEFANVDGLESEGNRFVAQRILFTKKEKPIVAQIWGMKPENYFKTAQKLVNMGFDGIDINMGCPQKHVTSHGACAALIKNHSLAKEIIHATQQGAKGLPVSVKTRIGYREIAIDDWIGFLLMQKLDALTFHLRTASEMSKVPAHWEMAKDIVKLRDIISPTTLVIGNGDVKNLTQAEEKVKEYGFDGIMIGRGIFDNPFLFNPSVDIHTVTLKQRFQLLLKHVDLWEKTWGSQKNFQVLKKYFKIYISGFDGAQALRIKLMEAKNSKEIRKIIHEAS